LILAAFNLAPESVDTDEISQIMSDRKNKDEASQPRDSNLSNYQNLLDNDKEHDRTVDKSVAARPTDRSDFYEQWNLLKAENMIESKVKTHLFGVLHEVLTLT